VLGGTAFETLAAVHSPRVLTLIMAGGKGSRLKSLTERRAKPAIPFAGVYRLIDFALSNCAHSGLQDVWVIEQFQAHSINQHLANGRPWDLDRTYGGLQIIPPFQGEKESGWHQGNADALWRNRRVIAEFGADLVLVLSADAIYRFDYRTAIEAHLAKKAEVTMVTTQVKASEATRFGNVRTADDGRVSGFAYKPEVPLGREVTAEIFLYDAKLLLEILDALIERRDEEIEDAQLEDYGHELLPEFVQRGKAYACPLDGYWRDVGTVESYFEAHQEWLKRKPPFPLDDPAWPIWSRFSASSPAHFGGDGSATDSLISPGCRVEGAVNRSVLGPGTIVGKGATIEDAILLNGVHVDAGVSIKNAIVDEGLRVRESVDGKNEIVIVSN
jgi:glucose-1-phosphate adenylyltransferase